LQDLKQFSTFLDVDFYKIRNKFNIQHLFVELFLALRYIFKFHPKKLPLPNIKKQLNYD